MSHRRKLIVGNWKLNGSLDQNAALLGALREAVRPDRWREVVVCVPYPYLHQTATLLSGSQIQWGSEDVSEHDVGAFTGEVSARMVAEFGAKFAIVGHSERRSLHGENDPVVASKTLAVLAASMTPILCVGETLAQREMDQTHEVVARQLSAVLSGLDAAQCARLVVAYEPVWAIGTGRTATPEQAQAVHAQLRELLVACFPEEGSGVPLLYGGSMKAQNARELLLQPDIDGGLIGGASLIAKDFLEIVAAASGAT